jgi:hypothetical protein
MKSSDDTEELEASIEALGYWMVVSTGVVVVGLFIELIPPLRKLWDDHDLKEFVGSSVGSLLVAGGVSAELLVEFFARRKERKLKLRNAEKDRQQQERLKLADVRIAEAEKGAAEARLETEKLRAQLAWRELTHEQTARLISELSVMPGSIVIEWVDGDAEALRFSNQFRYVFTEAKWTVGTRCFRGGSLVVTGLLLSLPPPTTVDSTPEEARLKIIGAWERDKIPEANSLRDSLKAIIGIEIGFSVGDWSRHWSQSSQSVLPPEPAIKLFIGAKPPPAQ